MKGLRLASMTVSHTRVLSQSVVSHLRVAYDWHITTAGDMLLCTYPNSASIRS